MNKNKKILAFSVGRSDFDRYFPILNELRQIETVDLQVALSSVHQLDILEKL